MATTIGIVVKTASLKQYMTIILGYSTQRFIHFALLTKKTAIHPITCAKMSIKVPSIAEIVHLLS